MKIYTQAELEGMSDLELNLIVPIARKHDGTIFEENVYRSVTRSINNGLINYCNNWNDCGSLIDECGISVIGDGDSGFYANNGYMDHSGSVIDAIYECDHKNPKRSVTIVYILIKQGE